MLQLGLTDLHCTLRHVAIEGSAHGSCVGEDSRLQACASSRCRCLHPVIQTQSLGGSSMCRAQTNQCGTQPVIGPVSYLLQQQGSSAVFSFPSIM